MSIVKHARFINAVLLLSLIIVRPAASETIKSSNCEQKLSFAEFRALALEKSPLIAEIDRKFAGQLSKAIELKLLANPELQAETVFTSMELAGANDAQTSISLGQPLRLSDFGKRENVARLIRKAGKSSKQAELFELSQKARLLYYRLWSLQKTAEVMKEAENRASQKLVLIKDAVSKGLLSAGEEQLFAGEKYRIMASGLGIASSIAMTQHEIQKTLGLNCVQTITPGNLTELESVNNLQSMAQNSLLAEGFRLEIFETLAREQSQLAELDAYPEFTPRLVYQHTNDGGDFIGFGFSIPLPVWDRNQAEQKRAEAELQAIKSRRALFAPDILESQIIQLRLAAENNREQLRLFESQVIPSFKAALKSEEDLFAKGKGNITQIWQSLRVLNEVQEQYLKLWNSAVSARIRLSLLIGEEI